MEASARGIAGWRALGAFWAAALLFLAFGAGSLAWLGPPMRSAPVVTEAAAPELPPPPPSALPRAIPPDFAALAEPALLEATAQGPLPRIGPEGRTPIRAYGRPFDRTDPRPRLAIVIGNAGLNGVLTEQAIERLPPEIGLAFSPYASRPLRLVALARERGMERLIGLPLEPTGFPLNDPGAQAILSGQPWAQNLERLEWALARVPGIVGAVGALGPMRGERFAALSDPLQMMQEQLARRGLLYLDPRPGQSPPARAWGRTVDVVIDEPATRGEIERALERLERLARERGSALGYAGDVAPVTVERIAAWAAGIETRGVVLAPPSALIRRPDSAAR
jgi:polysaccharide deacetylase 2 family uncharacterized protein YibQ